jgi:hypothetical protein
VRGSANQASLASALIFIAMFGVLLEGQTRIVVAPSQPRFDAIGIDELRALVGPPTSERRISSEILELTFGQGDGQLTLYMFGGIPYDVPPATPNPSVPLFYATATPGQLRDAAKAAMANERYGEAARILGLCVQYYPREEHKCRSLRTTALQSLENRVREINVYAANATDSLILAEAVRDAPDLAVGTQRWHELLGTTQAHNRSVVAKLRATKSTEADTRAANSARARLEQGIRYRPSTHFQERSLALGPRKCWRLPKSSWWPRPMA